MSLWMEFSSLFVYSMTCLQDSGIFERCQLIRDQSSKKERRKQKESEPLSELIRAPHVGGHTKPLAMLLRCALLSVIFVSAASFILPVANLANCAPPNGTDHQIHWWQCNAGPVQFLNATPFDSTGTKYEYPIHLSKPIVVKTQLINPTNTYVKPNLRNSINIWKYGGWSGCNWSAVPTLGLLKDQSACDNGVPCPVHPGNQELDVVIDFTQYEAIISLLKDNQPYQLEYMLHDKKSGDNACLMVQAWAYLK